ncbi:MAG: acyclic terpene utilization AtuA family protein, partial [Myxococcota bacterium]
MVEGGPIDVLTGDYLAELTMAILHKSRERRPGTGWATTFLRQLEEVLGACLDRGIRVVSNAGGLNPEGLAHEIEALCQRLGLSATIAWVTGDDLLDRLPGWLAQGEELRHCDTGQALSALDVVPLTANAYLGGFGIAEALRRGADVVVCPRVTDASLVVGPGIWAFDWGPGDWDALAGAVVAGHVIECG